MPFASHRSRAFGRGFTIIELLVAIGVTAILVTLMLTITLNVLNAWNRSSGKLSSNSTARLVLDQLSQDLGAVIMRRDGNVWLAATVQRDPATAAGDASTTDASWATSQKPAGTTAGGSLIVDEAQIGDLRFGKAGVWLRYFVAQPDSNAANSPQNSSAPRAVSFQIIRRNLGTAALPQYSYQLYRAEVRPYHTTAASQQRSTFGVGYDLYSTDGNGYNIAAVGNEKDASNIRNPTIAQLIGNDVIDFGVRFYERDAANILVQVFPVNKRDSVSAPTSAPFTYLACSDTGKTAVPNNAVIGAQTFGFPVEAELLVRVLTPEGVRLIQAFEEDATRFPGQTWWDIALRHSDVYTRRVEIKATAL